MSPEGNAPRSGLEETRHRNPLTEDEIRRVTVGDLQRLDRTIPMADYDQRWPQLFDREASRIRAVLEDRALRIEHVGSTSVPGLVAKPIIDILLVVPDSACEPEYLPALESAGYVLRVREPNWYEHRMFSGPGTSINLHTFSNGCPEVDRLLTFREWLRHNAADRDLYARTKIELSQRTWRFVQNYADAKTGVIEEIMRRATRR